MSPAARTFNGYPLPEIINPARRCIKFHIPDDTNHRRAFYGAILELSKWYNWERDNDKRGTEVAAVWRDVFAEIVANMDKGCDECDDCPDEGGCIDIQPSHPTIKWIHSDPFNPADCEPYWDCQPWDIIKDFHGFLPTGAVVTTTKNWVRGAGDNLLEITKSITERVLHPPGFKVRVKGSGRVQLYLTKVPLGGLALITVDGNPLSAKFEDMATFTAGNFAEWANALELLTGNVISGGFFSDQIIEVNLETYKEEHTIEVLFLPKLAFPDFLESGWGGGLRKIALCGVKPLMGGSEPPKVREVNGEVQVWDGMEWVTLLEYLHSFSGSDDCSDNCDEVEEMACCITNLRWNNGILEYMVCGEWKAVPGTPASGGTIPDIEPPPDGTVELAGNACYKANAAWWIISSFMDAFFESVEAETGTLLEYQYFQSHFPQLDENNLKLMSWIDGHGGYAAGTRTHWIDNRDAIGADFICQAQDIFSKSSRLSDVEYGEIQTWNFSTGSNELNAIIEASVRVPEKKFWYEIAAAYVDNQQGECDCSGSQPIDRTPTGEPGTGVWTHTFDFKTAQGYLGWQQDVQPNPDPALPQIHADGLRSIYYSLGSGNADMSVIMMRKYLSGADTTTRFTSAAFHMAYLNSCPGNEAASTQPLTTVATHSSGFTTQIDRVDRTYQNGVGFSGSPQVITFDMDETKVYVNSDSVRIQVTDGYAYYGSLSGFNTSALEKIVFTGTGKNPFTA